MALTVSAVETPPPASRCEGGVGVPSGEPYGLRQGGDQPVVDHYAQINIADTIDTTNSPIAAPQLASFLGFLRSPKREATVPTTMTPKPHRMATIEGHQSSSI